MALPAGTESGWDSLIEEIGKASDQLRGRTDPLGRHLSEAAGRILHLASMEKRLNAAYFAETPIERLQEDNDALFPLIEGNAYALSSMNPAVTVPELGKETGQAFSMWRSQIEGCNHVIFRHDRERLSAVFGVLPVLTALDGSEGLASVIIDVSRKMWAERFMKNTLEQIDPNFGFFRDTVFDARPGDPRHLYRYGARITPSDIEMARHVEGLPEAQADLIAGTFVRSYELGFSSEGKDLSKKGTASVSIPAGFERIGRKIESELAKLSIKPVFSSVSVRQRNRQLNYDHRFDWALLLDGDTKKTFLERARSGFETARTMAAAYSGPMHIGTFGEEPFSPVPGEFAVVADTEANTLYREFSMQMNELVEGFMPRVENSFVMMDFPSPEIRGDFRRIFDETLKMNTLDNDEYAIIQKVMIDALDRGEFVRVKGVEGNCTDLEIRLHHLDDPATQTNFLNCLATVNIPLGEVFTSPVLAGTNGKLHVEEAFIDGLKYKDLVMEFRDGFVADYGCANFAESGEGRRYVYENMLHPHKTLPMGEFAIGSNTWAYRMAKQHGIMDLMPVLILEKMGPHLAIGDTCFSREEDHPVHNPIDGKEVIARENEKTCTRKTNPMEAYTQKHTDITLPYTSLGSVSAMAADGSEVFIYRDGRFVLPGTEKLNEAL